MKMTDIILEGTVSGTYDITSGGFAVIGYTAYGELSVYTVSLRIARSTIPGDNELKELIPNSVKEVCKYIVENTSEVEGPHYIEFTNISLVIDPQEKIRIIFGNDTLLNTNNRSERTLSLTNTLDEMYDIVDGWSVRDRIIPNDLEKQVKKTNTICLAFSRGKGYTIVDPLVLTIVNPQQKYTTLFGGQLKVETDVDKETLTNDITNKLQNYHIKVTVT